MKRQLYPYQKDAVAYLKKTPMAALYMEMRLGKCITTIRALKDIPGRKLIICPKSVINTWADELEMEGISDYLWFSSEFLKRIPYKNMYALPQWCIVNYEASTRLSDTWKEMFQHIVIDESAWIKNPKAKVTKFFLQNFQNAERKILLSGNPAPNTPLEYFTQMQFLHGEWMNCKNYWQFRRRYFVSDIQGWQWWTRHSSKEVIKLELQKTCFFLSRKDVGVENKKVYEKRYVSMPASLQKEYNRMEKEFVATLPNGETLEIKHVVAQLIYLQEMAGGFLKDQAMSEHKIKELVSLLEGELKGEKVLVWCRFRWEIEAISKAIKTIRCVCITGDTKLGNRKIIQEGFNGDDYDILILQTATSKYGLNLSAADTSIYYSNTFVADDRTQSEMRIEHNSKKTPLLYIDLITRDSVDEHILKALQKKKKDSQFFMEVIEELRRKYK